MRWAALLCLLLFSLLLAASKSHAEVNQYGVDCSITPWMSSCGDEWKNQDGMNEYTIGDDGNANVPLPFTFNYWGQTFTNSWMMSNGAVVFMSPTGSFCCNGIDVVNGDWSNYSGLPYFSYSIAALWTDLRDYNVDVDGDGIDDTGFFTQEVDYDGDGVTDALRYLWRNISEYGRYDMVNTFGTEINDAGGVEIHHFDINIRSHNVTTGLYGDPRLGEVQQFLYEQMPYDNPLYEVYTFDLSDACTANPLISSTCPGYAKAYAEVVYQQNCSADPLYDSGCTGYAEAYYSQQCSISALYDEGCPGYANAYYDQQCSLNALYDSGCSGYETAYYNQQCSLDSLYDSGCPGYETAYFNYQCGLDALYDPLCEGYQTAYINSQCELDPLYSPTCSGYAAAVAEQESSVTSTTSDPANTVIVTDADSFIEPSVTGDATVDSILGDNNDTVGTSGFSVPGMDMAETQTEEIAATPAETGSTISESSTTIDSVATDTATESTEESIEAEIAMLDEGGTDEESVSESGSDVDESAEDNGDEQGDSEQSGDSESSSESDRASESGKSDSSDSKQDEKSKDAKSEQKEKLSPAEAKRKKLKEIATQRAMALADKMGEAATLEAQQAIQAQITALINFVPGFDAYGKAGIPGGDIYASEEIYKDKEIPENRRGLRNGLAQQILHEKMVEMQYKNKGDDNE